MRAANCVQFCQNPFWCEVHEGCLPHDKYDSDKAIHNSQLTSAWIRSWKSRAEHCILLFLLYKRNISSFLWLFQAPYIEPDGSVYEVSYPCTGVQVLYVFENMLSWLSFQNCACRSLNAFITIIYLYICKFSSKSNSSIYTTQTLISITIKLSIGLNALSLPLWHLVTFEFFLQIQGNFQW